MFNPFRQLLANLREAWIQEGEGPMETYLRHHPEYVRERQAYLAETAREMRRVSELMELEDNED